MAEHTGYYSGLSDYQNANDVLALAEDIKDQVVAAQVLATTAATTAQASLDVIVPNLDAIQNAGVNATTAADAATSAAASGTLAQAWATNPVDTPVTTGLYSAYHWAQKASQIVTGGLDSVYLRIDGNLSNIQSPSQARTNLGLGTAAVTDASAYQPVSSKLSNFINTSNTANTLTYNTSATDYAVTPLTSFGRSLIDDSSASVARTTLGLGTAATTDSTAYQPIDATLTSLSGLATGANNLPYSTGSKTFSQTPLTAFARSLLDDTDAATARATLGVTSTSSSQLVAAWASVTNTGTILAGYNVGNVQKITTGQYAVTLVQAMANTSYSVFGNYVGSGTALNVRLDTSTTPTTTTFRLFTLASGGSTDSGVTNIFFMVLSN